MEVPGRTVLAWCEDTFNTELPLSEGSKPETGRSFLKMSMRVRVNDARVPLDSEIPW